MPGFPDLQAQVSAMSAKLADLESSLAAHKLHLETALTELAVANANGASVPALIDLTTQLATEVNATIDAIKAWSENEVSQTYVEGLLP